MNPNLTNVEICQLLGITKFALTKYRTQGIPTNGVGKGMRYPGPECVAWFVQHEIDKARSTYKPEDMTRANAKDRKEIAEALLKETELERIRGTLVPIDDTKKELNRYYTIVRTGLLAFPARTAPYLVRIESEHNVRKLLEDSVRKLMDTMTKQVQAIEETPDEELDDDEDEEQE